MKSFSYTGFLSPYFHFGITFAHSLRVKLIIEESTMQNHVIEITQANPLELFGETLKASPPGCRMLLGQTRLTGDDLCDWHGICNNAGCPTIVDWRAI